MHNCPLNRINDNRRCAKPILGPCRNRLLAGCLFALLFSQNLLAALPDIRFKADRVEFQGSVVHSVKGILSQNGHLEINAEGLVLEGREEELMALELSCPQWKSGDYDFCLDGQWSTELRGLHSDDSFHSISGLISSASLADKAFKLSVGLSMDGLEAALVIDSGAGRTGAEITWADEGLDSLMGLRMMPAELQWLSRGSSTGRLWINVPPEGEPDFHYELELNDLSFDSPDGRFAAESLRIESEGSINPGPQARARVSGRISSGELLLDDFYRDFADAALVFEAQPSLKNSVLEVASINVTDNSSLHVEAHASFDLNATENALTFRISRLDLSFPGAYKRYIESLAAVLTLDGLGLTGNISWGGDWVDGAFESGELVLNDITIVDLSRGRFAVTGLDARLRPGDYDFPSRLAWRGLLLGPVNLGAGAAVLDSEPGRVALEESLELEVLGGRLTFHELGIELPGSLASVEQDLDFELRANLQNLDMKQLTAALDWPEFSGDISGEIPGVSLADGVLSVEGEITVEVFDGRISVGDLSIERPFGVLPSLAANVDVHDLSLEKLTQTFSFGQISGRLDGYIHDLRMLDWKPVAFDAWLGTPERQGKSNDISRMAVNRLTTLGGGSATTALTGPIMRVFNNFSYRRLGLGCHLQNNVCEMRGISEDEVSVLIMEGAGLPKIMIRAFNRSLNWPQLVAGLVAVSGDDSIKVGN